MKTFKPTLEQTNAVRAVLDNPSLRIKAFAGAAKTTTLQIVANTYRKKRIIYLAYNSSIQEEAAYKFNGLAEVRTIHSLALSYIRNGPIRLDVRNQNYREVEILNLLGVSYDEAKKILEVFKWFCNSDISLSEFAINHRNLETEKAIALYSLILQGKYYSTHDVYLKMFQLMLLGNKIEIEYDIAMIDEAQDLNDVKISIINYISTKRKIIVGDSHQQIYNFTGSVDAIDKIEGTTIYLTESFRFNAHIASRANALLSRFKNEKMPIKTNVENYDSEIKTRAFISRKNATLISELVSLYRNKRTDFKTIKDPENLFCLTLELNYLLNNEKEKIKVNRYLLNFKSLQSLNDYMEKGDDRELIAAKELLNEYGEEIVKIKDYAVSQYKKTEGISYYLMTAHTSKGLEFDEVIIANDYPTAPELIAKAGYLSIEDFIEDINNVDRKYIEEFNLLYVVITRAKISLVESDCKAMTYIDSDIDLLNAEIEINYEMDESKKRRRKN